MDMDQETEKKPETAAEEAAVTENAKPKKGTSQTPPKKKKKKKYKLQAMDIVTIVFTAIIVGIMAYVLYNQFAGGTGGGTVTPTAAPTDSSVADPTPTQKPALSDIGNFYGNITNDANVVVIDKREYYISADESGETHIFATVGDTTKDLIQTEASSLNVVTDYISYAGQSNVDAYYVFYINGSGDICYVYDGPVGGDGLEEKANLEEQIFLEGSYRSIDVSGEYVYYLTEDGQIGKADIAAKKTTLLSKERAYSSFVLYYGVIYAVGTEDHFLYTMPSNPASDTESTASPAPTADPEEKAGGEKAIISEPCRSFVIDSDWIYVLKENGLVRYLLDGSGKDTLSSAQVDAVNVLDGAIFYITDGKLFTASAEKLLLGEATEIAAASGQYINLSESAVYLKNENGKLLKSAYDTESKAYGAFREMN